MTEPKPVHEETWEADGRLVGLAGPQHGYFADFGYEPGNVEENMLRAQLAAAAPDLARALLGIEWEGHDDYYGAICPECQEPKNNWPNGNGGKHTSDCALDAALRKAGVR